MVTSEPATSDARTRLAKRLRRLREVSGRSLKDLEAETHASDSSLSRYLSGKTVPPWQVVEALCRAADEDPDGLRPLWEAARRARQRGEPPGIDEEPEVSAASTAVPPAAVSRWRRGQALLLVAAGVLLGVAGSQVVTVVEGWNAHPSGSAVRGPHFSVTLMEQTGGAAATAIWSFNSRCGNADEYRLTYDLPISVQHRATAYRLDRADCTVKLFDGVGGSGVGEPLADDQKLHPVPPELVRRGSSLVAYSCCNGTVLKPRP
ncbi:helix-turn-helix domain-containing protein [Actinomadura gamaensis]|uniref:Helix-turn-helix domain-containing protein n=1 Tax=Actinomadura gamaensis TaxID=1763541 RepID=A0ABV9TTP3_9ACTN